MTRSVNCPPHEIIISLVILDGLRFVVPDQGWLKDFPLSPFGTGDSGVGDDVEKCNPHLCFMWLLVGISTSLQSVHIKLSICPTQDVQSFVYLLSLAIYCVPLRSRPVQSVSHTWLTNRRRY
jgi:hypothetical protein